VITEHAIALQKAAYDRSVTYDVLMIDTNLEAPEYRFGDAGEILAPGGQFAPRAPRGTNESLVEKLLQSACVLLLNCRHPTAFKLVKVGTHAAVLKALTVPNLSRL
jgi:hypothetical protein